MRTIWGRRWVIAGVGAIVSTAGPSVAAESGLGDLGGQGNIGQAVDVVPPTAETAAQDKPGEALPLISVLGSFELQFDNSFSTSDPEAKVRSLSATIEPEITVNVSQNFRLFGHLVFEPVLDAPGGATSYFRDEGLYFEELYAEGTIGSVDISAGVIDPTFGLATDEAPGLYGSDFAEGYDFLGATGIATDWTLSSVDSGAHTVEQVLSASVFTADRTALGKSLFTNIGRTRLSDGGVGNTSAPESISLAYTYATLDGEERVAGPTGRLAVRRLAAGDGSAKDEWGILAAVETAVDLGNDRTLRPIGEAAYFFNEAGEPNDAIGLTLGARVDQGPWAVSLTGGTHRTDNSGTPVDYLITGSIGRAFEFGPTGGFRVDAGYSYAREGGDTASTVGILLSKDFAWNFGGVVGR